MTLDHVESIVLSTVSLDYLGKGEWSLPFDAHQFESNPLKLVRGLCSHLDGRRTVLALASETLLLLPKSLTLLSDALVQPALHQHLVADAGSPGELLEDFDHRARQSNTNGHRLLRARHGLGSVLPAGRGNLPLVPAPRLFRQLLLGHAFLGHCCLQ